MHPAGRGLVEKKVGIIKIMMKKFLSTQVTFNCEMLTYVVAKILNNSVTPKTDFKPSAMVFGQAGSNWTLLEPIT